MNMKRTLVLFLSLVMLLSAFGPTLNVFAEALHNHAEGDTKTTIDYVSLGDSMTNGIGMDGYDSTGHNGYLEIAPDSYPAQFAEWLKGETGKDVNLTQLATSAARVEDVFYILTRGTENEIAPDYWTQRELLANPDRWGDSRYGHGIDNLPKHEGHNNQVAGVFQEAITNADVISLATGNGNFGVFLMGRIMNLVGFGDESEKEIDFKEYGHYTLENALALLEQDEKTTEIIEEAFATALETAQNMGLPEALVDRVANLTAYVTASYLLYTMKLIDLIIEMNPDVTIIIVPLINNGQGFTLEVDGMLCDMGDFLGQIYNPINDLLAIYPTVQQYKGNYAEATFLYASLPEVDGEEVKIETFAEAFGDLYVDVPANATVDTYPASRLFCHNRFYEEIQSFVMPLFFGTPGGENSATNPFWHSFSDTDVRDYEIAMSQGTAAFAAYAAVNDPTKLQNIAYYLGIVDAVLTAMASTPSIDSSTIEMPEGQFSMSALLGPAVGGLTTELPGKVEENAYNELTTNEEFTYLIYELIKANITPLLAPYFTDPTFLYVFGADLEKYGDDSAEKTLEMLNLAGAFDPEAGYDARFDMDPALQAMRLALVDGYNQILAGVSNIAMLKVLPDTLSEGLRGVDILGALLALYGRMKLAFGLSSHPSQAGHDTLTDSLTNNYNDEGMSTELVLEKFYNLYLTVEGYGMLDDYAELNVVREIYNVLSDEKLITDEQTLDIILYTFVRVEDKTLSSNETTEIGTHVYETLLHNPLLSPAQRVAIVGNVYFTLKSNDYLNEVAATELVEELYAELDAQGLISDEQSLAIVDYVYEAIVDGELSEEESMGVLAFVYETLVYGAEDVDDSVAVIGTVYSVLNRNGYLSDYSEYLTVVEQIYTELANADLISNEQSFVIVDYLYESVMYGEVDAFETIVFIYNVIVKNTLPTVTYARRAEGETSPEALRIIIGVLAENYLDEENQKSVETLITGEDALINDELLIKLVDNAIADVENNEDADTDALVEIVSANAIQTVLDDENTPNDVKLAIVGEIKEVANQNGVVDDETNAVVDEVLALANKIYENLEKEGLMGQAEKDEIIAQLIEVATAVLAGEELTDDDIIAIVLNFGDIIFGREDLTLEQKVQILVVVYETLDEEGYITEENLMFIAGLVVEYYDEAYEYAYGYADEHGYIDVSVEAIDEAIKAIYLAIDEVEAGLLGLSDELTERLVKELYATIETLKELREVLASDSAKDVEGFVAAIFALEDDLFTHLNNIYAILEQVNIEYITPAIEAALHYINTVVIPEALAAAEAFTNALITYLQEKLGEFYSVLLGISEEVYNQIIETLVRIQLHVQDKLHNAFAPIVKAYFELIEVLTEIYGTIEEAVRVAAQIIDTVIDTYNYLNDKLNGALDAMLEEITAAYIALVKSLYNAYGNIEDALKAAFDIIKNIVDTVDGAIVDVINAYNALVNKLYEIYGNIETALAKAYEIYQNIVATVKGVIADAVELYNTILETLINVYGKVENAVIVAMQIFSRVYNFIAENITAEKISNLYNDIVTVVVNAYGVSKDVYYVASEVCAYLVHAFGTSFEGNYVVDEDSMYVALGNAVYGYELAEMLGLTDKYFNFDLTDDYLDAVAAADLITIRLDNGEALEFALGQLYDPQPLDWDKYLDAEGKEALDEVLAQIREELLVNGKAEELAGQLSEALDMPGLAITPEIVADLLVYTIECTLYSYADFIDRLVVVLENVTEAAPEATIVLTGIQNPLEGLDLGMLGLDFDLGEYAKAVDAVVDVLNAHLVVAALANENTIFVNSNEAQDIYDALNVTFAPGADDPTNTCNHVYDDCLDTTCNLCGAVRVAPGHSFTNYVYNEDAKCGVDGTETAKCDNCDAEDTREAHGTALAHVWADATCTAPKTCTLCGETEGDKLPHTWGEWKVLREPTHKVQGFREHKCLVCGRLEAEAIPCLEGLSTGAIIAICVGGVVVLAGVGMSVYVFLKKKGITAGDKKTVKKTTK